MLLFELLSLLIAGLFLLYLACFSPKFDRFIKRLFSRQSDSADGISDQFLSIEQQRVAAKAAIVAREKQLAQEKAKLDSLNGK